MDVKDGLDGADSNPTFQFISGPTAISVRWESEAGTTFEIAVTQPEGACILIGIKNGDKDGWLTTPIDSPERFGKAPETRAELIEFAKRFIRGE